jgi:hypothetical protein
VPEQLIEQEELDDLCPFMVEELETLIAERDLFKDAAEATIYALCQLLHNRLAKIDLTLEDKGAVVSTLISGLIDFNPGPLAAHNERMKLLREQKAGTVH